ncbi:protealysin inhibitor emfourin [Capillimicrobium parvum]|uniref:Uncharacterized protein n=1 Tax=Capillimicrobium parvum TaxID=2884022 RepID=A0A9E6XXY3_9ACTN|nr:protealysin inhibitor emfourin [Capillimicrobium parvum]UGS36416.1 hypothetical protein DSM104329_02820 [Capillimicrobium parvum]
MRIEFERQGGFGYFPGRRAAGVVETGALPPADAAALTELVERARFFALPARVGDPHGLAADARTYTIEVRQGDRRHRVQVSEPVPDPALEDLIAELQRRTRARSPDR